MSPQNPDKNKKKDDESKGGAVPLWPEGPQKKAPQAFWSNVNPPQTPGPQPLQPAANLPSFQGSKGKPSPFFPTLGSKGKPAGIPLLRGGAAGTLVSRLKGLKSKDIAFIVAGLSVLVLAPIAEHMISSPDETGGTLQQGFDQKGAVFGGSNPYEEGVSGIAPGGLPGQGTEVVTPLNVRDPSSLIMSPGGEEKKAPVQAEAPPQKPPTAPSDGWKDALKAAQKGVSKAAEKAHLPLPGGKLSKIPGLGSPSGNTHAALNLAAPTSSGLFSHPNNQNHLTHVTASPGYNGAARRGLASGSGGAGLASGGSRNMGGAGMASGEILPSGVWGGGSGPGGGSPSAGDSSKNPGATNNPENKNIGINQKEDLAFLRRKMEMEKAIGLKWDKKKYDQLERKKMLEQMAAQTAQQAFLKILDKLLEGAKGGGKDSKGDGGGPGGSPGGPGGDPGGNPPGGPGSGTGPGNTPRPQAEKPGGPQPAAPQQESGPTIRQNTQKGKQVVAQTKIGQIQLNKGGGDEPSIDDGQVGAAKQQLDQLGQLQKVEPKKDIEEPLQQGDERLKDAKAQFDKVPAQKGAAADLVSGYKGSLDPKRSAEIAARVLGASPTEDSGVKAVAGLGAEVNNMKKASGELLDAAGKLKENITGTATKAEQADGLAADNGVKKAGAEASTKLDGVAQQIATLKAEFQSAADDAVKKQKSAESAGKKTALTEIETALRESVDKAEASRRQAATEAAKAEQLSAEAVKKRDAFRAYGKGLLSRIDGQVSTIEALQRNPANQKDDAKKAYLGYMLKQLGEQKKAVQAMLDATGVYSEGLGSYSKAAGSLKSKIGEAGG